MSKIISQTCLTWEVWLYSGPLWDNECWATWFQIWFCLRLYRRSLILKRFMSKLPWGGLALRLWNQAPQGTRHIFEGSLEVKLPTIWTDEKQSRAEAERRRKIRREKIRRERVRGQKIQMREKVGTSRNTVFFQWFVAPEGRKVGSLKRRVRSQLARWEMKNCTPLWREAHFQVKMYKTPQVRTTFGSWDVEKVHAVVARSTFRSQNVQNTPGPDHFWKLRCWKSARRCGAKHISKSKCTKHNRSGPLLEVEMLKKRTPLWREAHFQVKMYKTHQVSDHFWKLRCRKSARCWGAKHISKSKCTKHHMFAPLLEVQMSLRFKTLHYRTLHYTTLQYTTLHYTTLHYTTLHYTTLHSTTLQLQQRNYTPLH